MYIPLTSFDSSVIGAITIKSSLGYGIPGPDGKFFRNLSTSD